MKSLTNYTDGLSALYKVHRIDFFVGYIEIIYR